MTTFKEFLAEKTRDIANIDALIAKINRDIKAGKTVTIENPRTAGNSILVAGRVKDIPKKFRIYSSNGDYPPSDFPIIILKKDVKYDGETYNWEQLALADQDYLETSTNKNLAEKTRDIANIDALIAKINRDIRAGKTVTIERSRTEGNPILIAGRVKDISKKFRIYSSNGDIPPSNFPIIILKKDIKHDGETYNWEQLALADQDYLESI